MRDFLGVFAGGGSSVALQSTFKTMQRADGLAGSWRETHTGVDALAVGHDGQGVGVCQGKVTPTPFFQICSGARLSDSARDILCAIVHKLIGFAAGMPPFELPERKSVP